MTESMITPPVQTDNGVAEELLQVPAESTPPEVSAPPAEEVKTEQPAPTSVDNAEKPEMTELERKVLDQSIKLRASKEEALRLKREKEALEAQMLAKSQANDETVSENDIQVFKTLARKAGLSFTEDIQAIKQQTYKEKSDEILHEFLTEHPEYSTSDEAWKQLEDEVQLYARPDDPKVWKTILNRAHKARTSDSNTILERGKSLGMAQAKIQEKAASMGSVSSGGISSTPKLKKNPDHQAIEDGFREAAPEYFS